MKNLNLLLPALVLFCTLSCDDNDETHPMIETKEAAVISASSFTAKGKLVTVGSIPVVDHGFIHGSHLDQHSINGNKTSLGKNPVAGDFEQVISITGQAIDYMGTGYKVRAYITNEKGTVYGDVVSFNLPMLELSSVVPMSGKAGDVITITGRNFSTTPQENMVRFGDAQAIVKSASSNELKVEIPTGAVSSYGWSNYVNISVRTGNQTVYASNFRILPTLSGFSPKSGTFNDIITITGSGLYGYSYTVYFGNVSVTPSSTSTNSLVFPVPTNASTESSKISVRIGSDLVELPGEFTILPPSVTSISPSTATTGSAITITGSRFNTGGYYSYTNTVKFGDIQASPYYNSSSQIMVYVPSGLTVGQTYDVSVFTGVHTVVSPVKFTLKNP